MENPVKRNRIRPRTYVDPPLDLYNRLDGALIGKLVDISDMGIKMLTDEPVQDNTFYRMIIKLPEKINDSDELHFDAITIRCQQETDLDVYAVGCQVLNIKPEDLKKLANLVLKYSQD
jgi:hypothetical protein